MEVTPFTAPEHYRVAICGWRCNIQSSMIAQKRSIRNILKTHQFDMENSFQIELGGENESQRFHTANIN
jgi:hypothetical protein